MNGTAFSFQENLGKPIILKSEKWEKSIQTKDTPVCKVPFGTAISWHIAFPVVPTINTKSKRRHYLLRMINTNWPWLVNYFQPKNLLINRTQMVHASCSSITAFLPSQSLLLLQFSFHLFSSYYLPVPNLMASSRVARFAMEVAPPQFITVMRHRATKMLDTITEEERDISTSNSASKTAPPAAAAAANSNYFFRRGSKTFFNLQ